jgi:hypothetical protein
MPPQTTVITLEDIQQHIYNWLYNIGEPINIRQLLVTYYPGFADYISDINNNPGSDKLIFLSDLRNYIEDHILYFNPINTDPEYSVVGLLNQVNIEIGLFYSGMQEIQEQQLRLQHYIASYIAANNGGQDISQSNIELLQQQLQDHKLHSKNLLILAAKLALARILLSVRNQVRAVEDAMQDVANLNTFINNLTTTNENDPTVIKQNIEIFVIICWNSWQLDIIETLIKYGLRLPDLLYLKNQLPSVISNNDHYSASIIERLTSNSELPIRLQIKEIQEEPDVIEVVPISNATVTPVTEATDNVPVVCDEIPVTEVTDETRVVSNETPVTKSMDEIPEVHGETPITEVPEVAQQVTEVVDELQAPEVVNTQVDVIPAPSTIVELSPQQLLDKCLADNFESKKFNTIIQENPTLLNYAIERLQILVSKKHNPKTTNKIIALINASQLPLQAYKKLTGSAQNDFYFACEAKQEKQLQHEFRAYLRSEETVLPADFRELMQKQFHDSIEKLNIHAVRSLISKGADVKLINKSGKDAFGVLLTKIVAPDYVNKNIKSIAQAIGVDLTDTANFPPAYSKLLLTELHAAVDELNIKQIRTLMALGADDNAKNEAGMDALAIFISKVEPPNKIDANKLAIAQVLGIDLIPSAEMSPEQKIKAEHLGNGVVLFKYSPDVNNSALTPEQFLDIFSKIQNESEIRLQSLLAYLNHTDSQGRPVLTICLQRRFTDTALKILTMSHFAATTKDAQQNTLLHTWAKFMPENLTMLQVLLTKYKAPSEDPRQDLNAEFGDSFIQTLIRNTKDESIALTALKRMFNKIDIDLLRLIFATKNNDGDTVIASSERRGWTEVTDFLSRILGDLFHYLTLNEVNLKRYFEYALDYFGHNSTDSLIHEKLNEKDYAAIQKIVEARDKLRSDIKGITKEVFFEDAGAFYAIVRIIFGTFEYYEIKVGNKILLDYINSSADPAHPSYPAYLNLLLSPILTRLITESPLTDSRIWQEIIEICDAQGLTPEAIDLLDKLKQHSIDCKVSHHLTDVDNATMLDHAAALGNLDLIKAVVERFDFDFKPKSLLNACASVQSLDTNNHSALEYLCELYEKSRLKDPELPPISEIRDASGLDMLCRAAISARSISKFRWLQQRGYYSNKNYIFGNNILQIVIINTGATEGTAQLDFTYTLSIVKQLLEFDASAFKQMVKDRDEFGGTALDQTIALTLKSEADKEPFYAILDLLIANGADLTNVTKCGQNMLHYVAEFGDKILAKYIKDHIINAHGPDQLDSMHSAKDEQGLTPMMLVDARKIKTKEMQESEYNAAKKKLLMTS